MTSPTITLIAGAMSCTLCGVGAAGTDDSLTGHRWVIEHGPGPAPCSPLVFKNQVPDGKGGYFVSAYVDWHGALCPPVLCDLITYREEMIGTLAADGTLTLSGIGIGIAPGCDPNYSLFGYTAELNAQGDMLLNGTWTSGNINCPSPGSWQAIADPCPDITCDSEVGIEDLFQLFGNWGPCKIECPLTCNGDLDGDGVVGIVDLFILFGNWGACPLPP